MHCMLMDLLHGFEVLSTTEETLFNSIKYRQLLINLKNFKAFTLENQSRSPRLISQHQKRSAKTKRLRTTYALDNDFKIGIHSFLA